MNDRQREKISLMSDKKYIFAITKQNTTLSRSFPTNERVQRNELKFPVESFHLTSKSAFGFDARDTCKSFFLVTNWIFLCFFYGAPQNVIQTADKCIQL